MNIGAYQRLYELEEKHWWCIGKRKIVFSILNKYLQPQHKVLDIGCGTGG